MDHSHLSVRKVILHLLLIRRNHIFRSLMFRTQKKPSILMLILTNNPFITSLLCWLWTTIDVPNHGWITKIWNFIRTITRNQRTKIHINPTIICIPNHLKLIKILLSTSPNFEKSHLWFPKPSNTTNTQARAHMPKIWSRKPLW